MDKPTKVTTMVQSSLPNTLMILDRTHTRTKTAEHIKTIHIALTLLRRLNSYAIESSRSSCSVAVEVVDIAVEVVDIANRSGVTEWDEAQSSRRI